MIISSSRIAPDVRSRYEEWLAAYDVEKGLSDWENRQGTAPRITGLTRRERQVVNLLLEGCDNVEIAKQLRIAHRTVKACFNRLFLRFGSHQWHQASETCKFGEKTRAHLGPERFGCAYI